MSDVTLPPEGDPSSLLVKVITGVRKAMMHREGVSKLEVQRELLAEVHNQIPSEARDMLQRIAAMPECPTWMKAILEAKK